MARLGDSVAKQEIQPFRCSIFFFLALLTVRCAAICGLETCL